MSREEWRAFLREKTDEEDLKRILALKALARREWKEGEKRAWQKCWYAPVDSPD